LLVHQKEESDSLLKRQEAIIEQLHSALEAINLEITFQQKKFEDEIRRLSDEAKTEQEGLRGRLIEVESEKQALHLQLEDLSQRVAA